MFKEEEVVEFSVILALSPNSRSGPALPQYHRQLNPCEIGQSQDITPTWKCVKKIVEEYILELRTYDQC